MDLPFATLTPANVLAKVAFSEVYETMIRRRQGNTTTEISAFRRLSAESEQRYHKDVLDFRREIERKPSGEDTSDSLTELDSDNEIDSQHLGMVWTGCHTLQLQLPPSTPDMGWTAGRSSLEKGPYADIFLCTKAFAKRHCPNLQSFHTRFNFDPQNRAFFIASITSSPLVGLTVNGDAVGRQMYALNQHSMKVRVDSLEYIFRYTDYASSKGFKEDRERYVSAISIESPVLFDMPTPHLNTRTIGQWTLSGALGKGAAGRVFLGSNSKNEMVAVKVMEHTSKTRSAIDEEIIRCQDLTALAQEQDDGGRLVRLREIIDPRETSPSSSAFEEVALVLEPMTPQTFADLMGNRSRG